MHVNTHIKKTISYDGVHQAVLVEQVDLDELMRNSSMIFRNT